MKNKHQNALVNIKKTPLGGPGQIFIDFGRFRRAMEFHKFGGRPGGGKNPAKLPNNQAFGRPEGSQKTVTPIGGRGVRNVPAPWVDHL